MEIFERDGKRFKRIFCRYKTLKNGKKIYHPTGKLFVFEVEIK